jgi:hypothetical protein
MWKMIEVGIEPNIVGERVFFRKRIRFWVICSDIVEKLWMISGKATRYHRDRVFVKLNNGMILDDSVFFLTEKECVERGGRLNLEPKFRATGYPLGSTFFAVSHNSSYPFEYIGPMVERVDFTTLLTRLDGEGQIVGVEPEYIRSVNLFSIPSFKSYITESNCEDSRLRRLVCDAKRDIESVKRKVAEEEEKLEAHRSQLSHHVLMMKRNDDFFGNG